jgi:glycosyltransferase involved in cell wall biosynthesis
MTGSTDGTLQVLEQFGQVKSLSYQPNKGKGWALRQGFELARREGYHYAISIDSDGQHFAS